MKQNLIVYGVSILITALAALFFQIVGYPFVITSKETMEIVAPPIYMIPIFLPYGILIGELIFRWIDKEDRRITIQFFFECTIVGGLSFFRYILGVPYSGHTFILAFYLLHQIIYNKNKYRIRILIGIFVLIITIIYKLILWSDPITFFVGIVLGVVIWLPGFFFRRKWLE